MADKNVWDDQYLAQLEDPTEKEEATKPTPPPTAQPTQAAVAERDRDQELEQAAETHQEIQKEAQAGNPEAQELASISADVKDWYGQMQQRLARYDEKEREYANKEAIQTVANGLIGIAAAWYGIRKGVDMSGYKPTTTDWEAKKKNLLDRIKVEQSMVEEGLKREDLAAYRTAEQARKRAEAQTKDATNKVKERIRQEGEYTKAATAVSKEIYKINSDEDLSEEQKQAAARAVIAANAKPLGLSEADIDELTTKEPGWWGRLWGDTKQAKNPEEVQASLTDKLVSRAATTAPTVQDGETKSKIPVGTVATKAGKRYIKTESGWKEIQ